MELSGIVKQNLLFLDLETTTQIIPTTSISTDEVTNISKIFSATTASLVIDRSTDSFLPTTELTDSAIATTAISSVESTTKNYPTTGKKYIHPYLK